MYVNVGGKNTNVQFLSRDELAQYSFADASICVCDEHTERIEGVPERRVIVLPAGEEHKSILSVQRILDTALEARLARDSSFIAFGGGVVCDMTAFAASIYMRGARLTLIPTT
ncbi:MAG TPA: 3-dehydroquinate synthase, partial [Spirochaetia bacterium]|nr:3-dehydroquinate synthase [Spirochaetia bacterium]